MQDTKIACIISAIKKKKKKISVPDHAHGASERGCRKILRKGKKNLLFFLILCSCLPYSRRSTFADEKALKEILLYLLPHLPDQPVCPGPLFTTLSTINPHSLLSLPVVIGLQHNSSGRAHASHGLRRSCIVKDAFVWTPWGTSWKSSPRRVKWKNIVREINADW